jgi:hypothetical protein
MGADRAWRTGERLQAAVRESERSRSVDQRLRVVCGAAPLTACFAPAVLHFVPVGQTYVQPRHGRATVAYGHPPTRRTASLGRKIVPTALPRVIGAPGGGAVSWVVTGYLLAETWSMPLWADPGDP